MKFQNVVYRCSIIALCCLSVTACATRDAEGVKYSAFAQDWFGPGSADDINNNAKAIYDTAQKGYNLIGYLSVNRIEGRNYSETVDSQAKEKAKELGVDLIMQVSKEKLKSTHDVSKGLEWRTRVQGVELVREHRTAWVAGDEYNYYATEYFAWKYNPSMAYTTIAPAAAALGYNDVLNQLMKKGVSPFASFSKKIELSPPALAIKARHGDTLRLLLAYEKKPSDRMYGLLEFAIKEGDLDAVKLLVKKGLDVNAPGYEYKPLMYAAENGHKDVVIYLLKKGADPTYSVLTYAGSTPKSVMASARRSNNPEIVKIIKDAICRVPKDCVAWFGKE